MSKAVETPIAADTPPIAADKDGENRWLKICIDQMPIRVSDQSYRGYPRQSAGYRRQSALPRPFARVTQER
jgi:hypothetical protein